MPIQNEDVCEEHAKCGPGPHKAHVAGGCTNEGWKVGTFGNQSLEVPNGEDREPKANQRRQRQMQPWPICTGAQKDRQQADN
jgi:hypothetical protein